MSYSQKSLGDAVSHFHKTRVEDTVCHKRLLEDTVCRKRLLEDTVCRKRLLEDTVCRKRLMEHSSVAKDSENELPTYQN
ncbi:hypothetical protein Bpfe_008802 [Biomphalaria pfeifferi]|uniref:Uncharacterized protein n=1 Tax=Biomphalaria pfeifferi TaxID=112525 RepID=A0AAD8BVZ5_BIOPF|nr:hypothetical protein Bpfe_008802 [Biomphalaria pfeifferi]